MLYSIDLRIHLLFNRMGGSSCAGFDTCKTVLTHYITQIRRLAGRTVLVHKEARDLDRL